MDRWVDISFDCLPFRSVGRLDIPLDASPKFRERCQRIKSAFEKHGSHNSYYLYNASCTYYLTNSNQLGMLKFTFEGTVLTDSCDECCERCDLVTELIAETCDWLTEPVVQWFSQTVSRSVMVEFDRYIQAGDLEKTRQRIEKLREASDDAGGFVGMYL